MAKWHGYFGIENLALNTSQKQTLVATLRNLGPPSDPQPARLCHWRTRLDGEAAIFEALFNKSNLTVTKFKQWLSAIFDIDPTTIAHTLQNVTFHARATPIATFSRGGIDYLRMALFGGTGASWLQSSAECRAYLALHTDEWEPPD